MQKGTTWEVELRDDCKVCGGDLPNARYRTFCSRKCRIKSYNDEAIASGYSAKYQRKWRKKQYEKIKI